MFETPERGTRVPPFKEYFASEDNMDCEQRQFYVKWLDAWKRGNPLSVEGNISYLFCYSYGVLAEPPQRTAEELKCLIAAYPSEEKFAEYCSAWLSDCYVLMADYQKALEAYPPVPISARGATCTDDILSLKLQVGEHISGRHVLTLNGPKVTKWGKEHLEAVASYLDIVVSAYEENNGINLLEEWRKTSYQYPYSVFRGTLLSSEASIPCYSFSTNQEVVEFIEEKTRDAENSVRDELKIPRVGEGWVSETTLYYELCRTLSDTKVIHHARPDWLGRQHLDILIPDHSVALEFQGTQHDQPVEYFGGEQAFKATRRRDARKKRLCSKNGIRLIHVHPGYDLQELIRQILKPD